MRTRHHGWWLVAGLVVAGACEGHRSVLERERLLGVLDAQQTSGGAGADVDLLEVLYPALGQGTAGPAPHPLLARQPASALRAQLSRPGPRPEDALIACVVAHAWGEVGLVLDACADVLDRFGNDPDADLAALVLRHWAGRSKSIGQRVETAWLGTPCRNIDVGCARRQWAVARLLDGVRRERPLPAENERSQARVTGPFDGDDTFAAARLRLGKPLAERPLRTRAFVTAPAEDGDWRPARHDEGGWYRMELFVDVARPGPVPVAISFSDVVVLGAGEDARTLRFGGEGPSMRVVWFSPQQAGVHRLTLHARFTSSEQPFSARVVGGLARLVSVQPTPRGALALAKEPESAPPTAARQWIGMVRATFGADASPADVIAAWGDLPVAWLSAPAGLALSADAVDRLSRIPAAERSAIRTRLFAALAPDWPHQPQLGLAGVRRALDEERYPEARAAMDALIAAHPDDLWLRRHRVPLALETQDLETARRDAAALGGANATPADLAAAAQVASALDDLARYGRLTERRLAESPDRDVEGLARRFARGEPGAEAALRARMEANPGGAADDVWLQRAELFAPEDAAQRLSALAERFPNAPAWALRRETLRGGAASDRLARRFSGREEVLFSRPLPPDVDDAVTALRQRVSGYTASPDPGFAGEELVFIDDTVARTIHPDGSAHVVRTYAVALLGRAAVDAFGEINVGGAERVLALYVARPDGTVREPERAEGISDVTLTGLAPGDVVAFASVRLEARGAWPYPAFEVRTLQNRAAALFRRHVITWPRDLPDIEPVWGNGAPDPRRTDTADARQVAWTVEHLGPLPAEPFSGPPDGDAPFAGYRWRDTDEAWAAARAAGWREASAPNPFLTRLARRVLANQPEVEPAEALRRFVSEAVPTGGTHRDAVASLWTRSGDRLVTFAALCAAAGMEVVPLALELPDRVGAEGLDPRRYGLAGVEIGGDDARVVVGTRSLSPIGRLPRWLDGAVRLDLAPPQAPSGFFERLLSSDPERREELNSDIVETDPVVTQIALERDDTGRWVGALRMTVPPAEAGVVQEALAGSPAEALEDVFARWLAAGYPQARVGGVRFSSRIVGGQPLVVAVGFSLATDDDVGELVLADAVPGLASVLLQLSVDPAAYLNPAERARTLFRQPLWETVEVQIDVDPRETFVEVPQNVDVDLDGLAIEQRVELTDGRFLLSRQVRVEAGTAAPEAWAKARPRWGGALRKLEAPLRVVAAPRQTAQNQPQPAPGP